MAVPTLLHSLDLTRETFVTLGAPGLFAVAVLEFFLLPVPPDLVLVPLVAARPDLALAYAAVATAGSVLAGLAGFAIGRVGGRPALESRFAGDRIERVEAHVDTHGTATVAVIAFAPIPEGYELASVASGVLGLAPRRYLLASIAGRGGKYGLEALLVVALGDLVSEFGAVALYGATGAVAAIVAAALLRRRWRPGRRLAGG